MRLKIPSVQTYSSINKMVDNLYATNNFSLINYDIIHKNNKNILQLSTTEINNQYMMKFGLHYDKIFKTGLLINLTFKRLIFNNSTISLDLIIGDNPRYYLNYFIDNGFIPSFGFYASGMSFDIKTYQSITAEKWLWFRNEAFIQSTWRDKFAIGAGISHDYFRVENNSNFINSKNYINPYLFIKADTQNDKSFTTKGFSLNIEAKYINLLKINSLFQIKAKTDFSFPINSWITYRLESFAGLSSLVPSLFYQYHMGGIFDQNLGNFTSFQGYFLGEEKNANLFTATNSLMFNINKNYFIIPTFSIAESFDSFRDFNSLKKTHSSLGITLGYKSPFGPIKINYSNALKSSSKGIFNIILGHSF